MQQVAQLHATRRYITGVLLNVDIKPSEVKLDAFLAMLESWADNPQTYMEIVREHN